MIKEKQDENNAQLFILSPDCVIQGKKHNKRIKTKFSHVLVNTTILPFGPEVCNMYHHVISSFNATRIPHDPPFIRRSN